MQQFQGHPSRNIAVVFCHETARDKGHYYLGCASGQSAPIGFTSIVPAETASVKGEIRWSGPSNGFRLSRSEVVRDRLAL